MATSHFKTEQYASDAFVESAGAVMFRFSTKEICILHLPSKNEYFLAKGRRNCGETTQEAALREVTEETGYPCTLLPLNMSTRAPPEGETEQLPDEARFYTGIREPFTLQIRRLGSDGVKLIWWYIAAIDEEKAVGTPEEKFTVEFHNYTDVLEKLTFQLDRDMVKKAIEIVNNTYGM